MAGFSNIPNVKAIIDLDCDKVAENLHYHFWGWSCIFPTFKTPTTKYGETSTYNLAIRNLQ